MDPSISEKAGLTPTPDQMKSVEILVAEMDSAAMLKAIKARESTPTPVMEKILQIRPTSHWGLNE